MTKKQSNRLWLALSFTMKVRKPKTGSRYQGIVQDRTEKFYEVNARFTEYGNFITNQHRE